LSRLTALIAGAQARLTALTPAERESMARYRTKRAHILKNRVSIHEFFLEDLYDPAENVTQLYPNFTASNANQDTDRVPISLKKFVFYTALSLAIVDTSPPDVERRFAIFSDKFLIIPLAFANLFALSTKMFAKPKYASFSSIRFIQIFMRTLYRVAKFCRVTHQDKYYNQLIVMTEQFTEFIKNYPADRLEEYFPITLTNIAYNHLLPLATDRPLN
jgi:hypothetical protein